MAERRYAWPTGHWDWYQHLAFKHGVRAGTLTCVGGQVDKSPAGEPLHVNDLAAQTAVVMRHIDTVLREFGSGLADVVKLVAFYATDGSVDETAFLADIGRHVLTHGQLHVAGRHARQQMLGQRIGQAHVDVGVLLAVERDHARHQGAGHELRRGKP